jgi:hypothetical protein
VFGGKQCLPESKLGRFEWEFKPKRIPNNTANNVLCLQARTQEESAIKTPPPLDLQLLTLSERKIVKEFGNNFFIETQVI